MKNADERSVVQTVIAANLEAMAERLGNMAKLAEEAAGAMRKSEQNLAIGTVLGFESQIPEIEALFKTAILMHRNSA